MNHTVIWCWFLVLRVVQNVVNRGISVRRFTKYGKLIPIMNLEIVRLKKYKELLISIPEVNCILGWMEWLNDSKILNSLLYPV